jgi:putative transposase
VTQRGNRRERVFFADGDYRFYLDLVAEAARRAQTAIWAYCLMPNHVHFIMVPSAADGLQATFAEAHRRYTGAINARNKWTGHLWQGRFNSCVMDERHLIAAARYVPLNPVRAGLVAHAAAWPWSSVHAHLSGRDDGVVAVAPLLARVGDFSAFMETAPDEPAIAALRHARSTGRPVGGQDWIAEIEAQVERALAPRKRGPKPRSTESVAQPGLFDDA